MARRLWRHAAPGNWSAESWWRSVFILAIRALNGDILMSEWRVPAVNTWASSQPAKRMYICMYVCTFNGPWDTTMTSFVNLLICWQAREIVECIFHKYLAAAHALPLKTKIENDWMQFNKCIIFNFIFFPQFFINYGGRIMGKKQRTDRGLQGDKTKARFMH